VNNKVAKFENSRGRRRPFWKWSCIYKLAASRQISIKFGGTDTHLASKYIHVI